MAAQDDVDAGDAARELQVDVHAVMRQQQHGIDLVLLAVQIDELLQFVVADAERPVRREALGMRDRDVRKRLADHGDAIAADLLDRRRLEHAARGGIERLGVIELRFIGEEDILRQEFTLEAPEILAQRLLAIGEFPMTGHRLDAEQVRRLHHVGATHGVGEARALPQVAAVEQHGIVLAGLAAQSVDQRLQMGEAAEAAEAQGGFLEIDRSEGIGVGAVGADAEAVEKSLGNQMRRLSRHVADTEVDAGLAEERGQQLGMRIRQVQDARFAEALDVVEARAVGCARGGKDAAGQGRRARKLQKIPPAELHREIALRPLLFAHDLSENRCTPFRIMR